jgi:hypothetical protein
MSSAIVYLLRATEPDVRDVVRSINSLKAHVLCTYSYPVIVFVEHDFTKAFISRIREETDLDVLFEFIQFDVPEQHADFDIPKILVTHNGTQRWPMGYRHMCRFWTGEFLNHPTIQRFTYIWRMDSDAFITRPLQYDVFEHMASNDLVYGYSNVCFDDAEVCEGLEALCRSVIGKDFTWSPIYSMFTTHVEVMDVRKMKDGRYFDFYKAIDNTLGFYQYRWGDAPIRYIAMKNLGLKHARLDIPYFHGNDGSGRREQIRLQTKRISQLADSSFFSD